MQDYSFVAARDTRRKGNGLLWPNEYRAFRASGGNEPFKRSRRCDYIYGAIAGMSANAYNNGLVFVLFYKCRRSLVNGHRVTVRVIFKQRSLFSLTITKIVQRNRPRRGCRYFSQFRQSDVVRVI
jgi:hypothetical protein